MTGPAVAEYGTTSGAESGSPADGAAAALRCFCKSTRMLSFAAVDSCSSILSGLKRTVRAAHKQTGLEAPELL